LCYDMQQDVINSAQNDVSTEVVISSSVISSRNVRTV
jgi:hypothetical protein